MAVQLPQPPKAYSKAARSPRQTTNVDANTSPRRPHTSDSPRGSSTGGRPALQVRRRDLPSVSYDEAAHAEGGRFIQAALHEYQLQYVRDTAAAPQAAEERNSPVKLVDRPSNHAALADLAGQETRDDIGERFRGMTSSPRLADSSLLRNIVNDHLEAKCVAFSRAIALDDHELASLSHQHRQVDVPTPRRSPISTHSGLGVRGGSSKTMAYLCNALRDDLDSARRVAQEVVDAAGVELDKNGQPTGLVAKAPSATQLAYLQMMAGINSGRGGVSPRSHSEEVPSNESSPQRRREDSEDATMRKLGLSDEEIERLHRLAQELIAAKKVSREEKAVRNRGHPATVPSSTFVSATARFSDYDDDNPPVGQYNPRTGGVHRHTRNAIIDARPRNKYHQHQLMLQQQLATPGRNQPTSPRRDNLADDVASLNGDLAGSAPSEQSPNMGSLNLGFAGSATYGSLRSGHGDERHRMESPRARAQRAAAAAAPPVLKPTWPFASSSQQVASAARQLVCRDVVYNRSNDDVLSTQKSPRGGPIGFGLASGRDLDVTHRGASDAGPGAAPPTLPDPPPGLAERCGVHVPTRATGTGGDPAASPRAHMMARTGTDGEGVELTSTGRFNVDGAIQNAGANAVRGKGAPGFVDFGRQVERARPSGSRVLATAAKTAANHEGAMSIDNVDFTQFVRDEPVGVVEFQKHRARPPLHDTVQYSLAEHTDILPPQPRHLRNIAFDKLGPWNTKPLVPACSAEAYDADFGSVEPRSRAAAMDRVTAARARPSPTDRVDYEHSKEHGEIARRTRVNPAAGVQPTTRFSKHTYPTSENVNLNPSLNATRPRRVDRAPAMDKYLGHREHCVHMNECEAIDQANRDPDVVHHRVAGDPMIAKHIDRETRDSRLQPRPPQPLTIEEATAKLGVKKAVALQAERAEAGKADLYTRTLDAVRDATSRTDLGKSTPRSLYPAGRLAVGYPTINDVPGPGTYFV
jgi:hypothetical protein